MFSSRLAILVLFACGAVGLLAACEQPSTYDVDQTEEGVLRLGAVAAVDTLTRTVAPNDRPLVIDGFRGTVDLRGSSQETAELRFIRRARGEDVETARGVLEDVTLTESGSQETYTYTLESEGQAYAAVDVRGTVPRQAELRIEQTSGPVEITGVKGPITVNHEHGPVTIRGAAASTDVEIQNGDIVAQFTAVPSEASIQLRTSNGDITLRLPPAASAQLRAETSAGVIRTQGLPLADQRFNPRAAGGRYTAQLGAGEASVELQTENGSILIAATDTTAIDTTEGMPAMADTLTDNGERDALKVPPSDTTIAPPLPTDTAARDTTSPDTSAADTAQL